MSNPLESWTEEQRSALLYRTCAEAERDSARAELFRRLAGEAEAQAAIWRAQLTARGHPAPTPYVPDTRTRLVMALVSKLGPRRMRSMLAAMKVRGMGIYDLALPMESGHATPRAGSGTEHRHRGLHGGGNLRAAVFGVNDGLISNASLILGVAGASPDPHAVILTGIAGMCAGAFAMATGEYVSVRSQRELFEYQIGLERDELGSPWGAAISSFLSFAIGAFLPLAPFMVLSGPRTLPVAIGVTALALFGVGALLSLFTGRGALRSGLRMLVLGAIAGAVTFAVGRLVGVSLG